mgnify:FL=1
MERRQGKQARHALVPRLAREREGELRNSRRGKRNLRTSWGLLPSAAVLLGEAARILPECPSSSSESCASAALLAGSATEPGDFAGTPSEAMRAALQALSSRSTGSSASEETPAVPMAATSDGSSPRAASRSSSAAFRRFNASS